MPEPKLISCVHCGHDVGPHDIWTEHCDCGTGRQPMPNPENRLQDILERLGRVSGDVGRWSGYRYESNGVWGDFNVEGSGVFLVGQKSNL
jgi:hypothetical protein